MRHFAKAFVINLPFKTDRLTRFQAEVPACFGDIQVWPAVHGDSIAHPPWWDSGAGAWGCYRSHLQILEYCYQNQIDNYIVFEDDAIFAPGAEAATDRFMSELPVDWEMVYLGGQLWHEGQHPPQRINDHVYAPYNVNRTHCFALHKRGYEKVYKHLCDRMQAGDHIDHHLGRLHESGSLKVYVPAKWIIGQDGGLSNISGNCNAAQFWVDPEKSAGTDPKWTNRYIPSIYLKAPIDVAIALERRGWHRGHWQNTDRLDRGICEAVGSADCRPGITTWHKAVMPEAVREGRVCVCLFHPRLSWACIEKMPQKFQKIEATDVREAESQLDAILAAQPEEIDRNREKRHLIYHVYPRKGNGVWQWNVDQLLQRIEQFDGVRSISIATDDTTDSAATVRAKFVEHSIDNFIEVINDPKLGEVTSFLRLMKTLPRDGLAFYAHAKGVSYDDPLKVRDWTTMLYEICLDDPKFIDAALSEKEVAGPFPVANSWPGGNRYGWYFSGAFYWFRPSALDDRQGWARIRQDRWGAELWPGQVWDQTEYGTLFGQHLGHLYKDKVLEQAKAWFAEWRSAGMSQIPS